MARPRLALYRPVPREVGEADDAALVRGALGHLYDLAYLQRHPLADWLPEEKSRTAGRRLQQQLLAAIEQLRPAGTPSPGHDWRAYQLLTWRYVDGLSVLAVQEKLALSKSEYFRDHQRALAAVASLLSERLAPSPGERPGAYPGGAGLRVAGTAGAGGPAPPRFSPRRPLADVVTSFVGREQELTALADLLAGSRHVTLTGAGGCGKSRLALRTAATLAAEYPDGIAFVELAPLSDPGAVEATVAATLGVREERGRPIVETLREALAERRVLLVLDNCEHLLDACARLAEALLCACPGLRLLATSREPLLIAGEVVYRVPSLAVPPPGARSPEQVGRYAAVQVFVDRAQAAQPGFTLTSLNAPLVAQICVCLDGIPLALELAAVRTRALSMEQLATHLNENFRLLTAGSRTALRRQQTLRATIDWSFNLLADQERVLFRRLAVFVGGWTLEAAEAVCAGDGVDQADVADLLARLVDKSVVATMPGAGELARYRLLETLREYAGERLAGSGETDTVRWRHARYFVALAERAELPGPRYSQWVMRLDAEQGNVRGAFGWLRAQGANEQQARLVAALGWYWMQSGSTNETRSWADEALAWTAALGVHPLRAGALYAAGLVAYDLGDLRASRAWLQESLALWEQLGDRRGTAWALLYAAQLARDGGDFAVARALTLRSLELFRALGDAWAEVFALTRLGLTAVAAGDLEEARRWHEQALAGIRALGDQEGIAAVLGYLGAAARAGGDLAAAARAFSEALLLNRDLGWARGVAERLAPLAGLAELIGQSERAARLLGATAAQLDLGGAGRLLPSTRAAYERDRAAVRTRLGEAAFARELAAGAGLPIAAAVAEALAVASAIDGAIAMPPAGDIRGHGESR
jgi:predicted ATPase